MQPEEWILEGEVGTSSKTIWSVMMNVIKSPRQCDDWHYDVPHDPDDFSRCHKLLELFPYWRNRINEVGNIFPKWKPFCREWDKLEMMYMRWLIDVQNYHKAESLYYYKKPHTKKPRFNDFDTTKMYDFMQTLVEEGMKLDGWIQDSPSSWHRPN